MAFRNNGTTKKQPVLTINAKNDHLEYTSPKNPKYLNYIEFKKFETNLGQEWRIGLSFKSVRGFIANSAFISTIRERDLATVDTEKKEEGRDQYIRKFEGNSEEPGAKWDEYEVKDISRGIVVTGDASYNYTNSGNIYCHFTQPSAAQKEIVDFLTEVINYSDLNSENTEKLIEFCQLPFPYEAQLLFTTPKHDANFEILFALSEQISSVNQEIKELGAKLGLGLFAMAPINDSREVVSLQNHPPGLNVSGV